VALDDFEVVVDMTSAAMRPSWELYHSQQGNHRNCGEECFTEVQRLVREMLTQLPLCSKCWHEQNARRPLAADVLELVEQGPAAMIPDEWLFQWKKVPRGA